MKWDSKVRKSGKVIILDNGAHTAKIGTNLVQNPTIVPNCIMKVKSERRRAFVAEQIEDCGDLSGLFYILPTQKGYIANWDVQKMLWDHIFSKPFLSGKLSDIPLLITEPCFNFPTVQEAMDEILFEEYDCCGLVRLNSADLSAYNYCRNKTNELQNNKRMEWPDSRPLDVNKPTTTYQSSGHVVNCVVVDVGYSFMHVVPYIKGKKYLPGIKRVDVGGKLLTNHLKEIISYRQLNVMDETYVVNQVKEAACYVTSEFNNQMKLASYKDSRNNIARDYVLPDYSTVKNGYLKQPKYETNLETTSTSHEEDQQIITMNHERFTIPELLFKPSDVGIRQMGISETLMLSIKQCPKKYQPILLSNILIIGGSASFPGFGTRFYRDIRKEVEDIIDVKFFAPNNPVTYCWEGGNLLANNDYFFDLLVTKEDYAEYGPNICNETFKKFRLQGSRRFSIQNGLGWNSIKLNNPDYWDEQCKENNSCYGNSIYDNFTYLPNLMDQEESGIIAKHLDNNVEGQRPQSQTSITEKWPKPLSSNTILTNEMQPIVLLERLKEWPKPLFRT